MRSLRLLKILVTIYRFGLDAWAAEHVRSLRFVWHLGRRSRMQAPRGQRLREALESLGPLFVKFGQALSTRRDLLPADVADELARLQDQVAPFDSELAVAEIERGLGRKLEAVFASFERKPVASASIAQVHFAVLKEGKQAGRAVAVKVLRPGMRAAIESDLALMHAAAAWLERLWADARRLRLRAVVQEFDQYLHDELDLMREAANASQLRRNFEDSDLLLIPEMLWDYCAPNVIVMERMSGIAVSQVDKLREAGIDIRKLSSSAVEVFFLQALRDGFFHADMHPGNIYVADSGEHKGRWIALDFGIVGTLTEGDKSYLAQNFLAFFKRDYRRVALLHLESGWVPAGTRIDALEGAIRAACEPIFNRPLKDISFAQVLVRLFETSRRFNVEVQPQLVLLQKTLFNIEGLGRQLDPDLDLWATAMPFLERHMHRQMGLQGLEQRFGHEVGQWIQWLPQWPRLLHQALVDAPARAAAQQAQWRQLLDESRKRNRWLMGLVGILGVGVLMMLWVFLGWPLPRA